MIKKHDQHLLGGGGHDDHGKGHGNALKRKQTTKLDKNVLWNR